MEEFLILFNFSKVDWYCFRDNLQQWFYYVFEIFRGVKQERQVLINLQYKLFPAIEGTTIVVSNPPIRTKLHFHLDANPWHI